MMKAADRIGIRREVFRGRLGERELLDSVARELGAELAFVTVSPENPHSLNNVMKHGFEVYDRREMYGGIDRYILKKGV